MTIVSFVVLLSLLFAATIFRLLVSLLARPVMKLNAMMNVVVRLMEIPTTLDKLSNKVVRVADVHLVVLLSAVASSWEKGKRFGILVQVKLFSILTKSCCSIPK